MLVTQFTQEYKNYEKSALALTCQFVNIQCQFTHVIPYMYRKLILLFCFLLEQFNMV